MLNIEKIKAEVIAAKELKEKQEAERRLELNKTYTARLELCSDNIADAVRKAYENDFKKLIVKIRQGHRLQIPHSVVGRDSVTLFMSVGEKPFSEMRHVQIMRTALAKFFGIPLDIRNITVNGYERDSEEYFTYSLCI